MVSQLKAGWLGDHVIGCQVIVGRGVGGNERT